MHAQQVGYVEESHNNTICVAMLMPSYFSIITFCVSRRRRKMYCGHARLSVCVSVCLSVSVRGACPHYYTDPDVTWGVVGDAP